MSINIKKYRIFRCSKCKNFNMSSAEKYFKCKYCGNNISLKNIRIYFENENPTIVSKVLIKIKEEDFKRRNEFENRENDFGFN